MRIKFTFTNFPGEGPLIECDGYTHRAADYYAGAACNAHRDIASMAMLSLGKSPASPEAVKLAMLTAVDHLRKQIDAALLAHEHVPSLHQHAGVDAAHLFGGWLELIEMVRCRTGIRVVRVTSSEVHAVSGIVLPPRIAEGLSDTERRRAKAERREELKRRIIATAHARGWQVLNDNEADACFVGVAALAKGAFA